MISGMTEIDSRAPCLLVLVFSWNLIELSVLDKSCTGLMIGKTDAGSPALLANVEYPLISLPVREGIIKVQPFCEEDRERVYLEVPFETGVHTPEVWCSREDVLCI